MKRFSFIIAGILFISSGSLLAQNEIDALRYSRTFTIGTAKSLSMGGAMGSIGGDFTSLSINPAGIGLYRSSEFTISPSLYWNNTTSDFLGNSYSDEAYNFGLGNIGFVISKNKGRESGWIGTSFGFGYNRINDFNQEIFMRGVNTQSSFLDNFVDFANAYPNNLDPLYEQLAIDANLLFVDTNTDLYANDMQGVGYGQTQQRQISNHGYMGEYTFSYGANYNHRLYIGATLGINRLNFEQIVSHTESDPTGIIPVFDSFEFEEYLSTVGSGYSLKFGVIGRPISFLRVGAAFHLPTFYRLNDLYENSVYSYFDNGSDVSNETAFSGLYEYNYRLRTPFKLVGSASVIIGKLGMISIDYEFIDYSNAKLEASGESFWPENSTISSLYKPASNLKIGGELKLGAIYLRGGYGFYGSPYATGQPNVESNRNIFSGGIGIKSRFFFIDAAYSFYSEEMNYYLYVPQMTEGAINSISGNTAQVTLGFRF